ncbi:hypothetical protein RND81_01G055200 [Saponaria officinalis]|uniref:Reverse transcriptase zinc-binding domain-containing protein n=1 Tax=Saponaria officinalis TaxID=3572 RepID=A0AAW1NCA2_SAPOF
MCRDVLPVRSRLAHIGLNVTLECCVCGCYQEDQAHLFYDCVYVRLVVAGVLKVMEIDFRVGVSCWLEWSQTIDADKSTRRVLLTLIKATLYWTWNQRNYARLERKLWRPEKLIKLICNDIVPRLRMYLRRKRCHSLGKWVQRLIIV